MARSLAKSFHQNESGDIRPLFIVRDFEIRSGQWVVLRGANGVGKTVFSKCLAGLIPPDPGSEVLVDEHKISPGRTAAIAAGIDYVPQDRILGRAAGSISVSDFLQIRSMRWSTRSARREMRERWKSALAEPLWAASWLRESTLDLRLGALSPTQELFLYLIRAVMTGARLIILDEPTAGLPGNEAPAIYGVLDKLRDQGIAIMTVAHPQQLRAVRSELLATTRVLRLTSEGLSKHGPGSTAIASTDRLAYVRPEVRWRAAFRFNGWVAVEDAATTVVSIEPGQIVAIIGPPSEEFIRLQKEFATPHRTRRISVTSNTAGELKQIKYSFLPERFRFKRLCPDQSLADNSIIDRWSDREIQILYSILAKLVTRLHLEPILSLGRIKPPESIGAQSVLARHLSGGNQQRFVLGRALHRSPDLLVCVDPFEGLDEDAVVHISEMFRRHACGGQAVVLFTSNPDVADWNLADRVIRLNQSDNGI